MTKIRTCSHSSEEGGRLSATGNGQHSPVLNSASACNMVDVPPVGVLLGVKSRFGCCRPKARRFFVFDLSIAIYCDIAISQQKWDWESEIIKRKLLHQHIAIVTDKKKDPNYGLIRAFVPQDLLRKFKLYCIDNGLDNSQGLESLLREYFEEKDRHKD